MAQFYYDPERLGRKRLPDNKNYRADLQGRSDIILSALQDLVPSNYPKTQNSNFGIVYRSLSREFARMQQSMELINDDKVYEQTRIEYIQQILGERLFLNQTLTTSSYNDQAYREYLIAIKDAYLKGSSKSNIESVVKQLTKQQINLKELYLEARKPNSSYSLIDTHKMVLEVFVDDLIASGKDLITIASEMNFFINLVRPAHVLYDTKFIWTEEFDINKTKNILFGDTGGGCIPLYLYDSFEDRAVLATKILVVNPPTSGSFRIASIHLDDLNIYLDNGLRIIFEPGANGTQLYGVNGKRIFFEELQIGQYINLDYLEIPGEFQFYWTPPDILANPNSQFYKSTIQKPSFQENVKKVMDAQGRFPLQVRTTETTLCDRVVQDVLQPQYEDLRKNCSEVEERNRNYTVTLAKHMWSPRFSYESFQGESLGRVLSGDNYSFTMPYSPLTDGSSHTATPSSIGVLKDSTAIYNSVQTVDSSNSYINLFDTTSYWDTTSLNPTNSAPFTGDEFTFNYFYGADTTNVSASTTCIFGISKWTLPNVPVSNGDGSNTLALPSDVKIYVDGTNIPDAVLSLDPILGHVTLQDKKDFWVASPIARVPEIGDNIKFEYYQSGAANYSMLFDGVARGFDDHMVFDGAEGVADISRAAVLSYEPLKVGYKYRADLLHHASVLNSPDTLLLNNYQKPATRASIVNRQDNLNHFNYFFSPEHLYDTSTDIVLNDNYLDKDNDPYLILNAGTPPFQKTFAYQPHLIEQRKLQDIRKHHHPLMYSDLLLKEYNYGTEDVPLSSICDQDTYSFKFTFKEELDEIRECESWILFDTVETDLKTITLPGLGTGVANLRVPAKKLRDNLILRESGAIGVTSNTYSEYITYSKIDFQLPATIVYPEKLTPTQGLYPIDVDPIDFPALPVVKRDLSLATAADVVVRLDGVVVEGIISYFDPVTGQIQITPLTPGLTTNYIELTSANINDNYIRLSKTPIQEDLVALKIYKGSAQEYGVDFIVEGDILSWNGFILENNLEAGDILIVEYPTEALDNVTISFTYNILSTNIAKVLDKKRSRIFDDEYVFPAACFDGYENKIEIQQKEYINFLSDYSDGIKFTYFNKDTFQIEEHVFTGPVFESYDPHEDQISSPESFPNALIKIRNPMYSIDPLKILASYDFVNDPAVRIRKKTLRELLPDRTFRTTNVMEVLPV